MIRIWHYLLSSYLKIFFLSMTTFITLLLISRLEEIAHFISLGAKWTTVLRFIGYQIPYILPIAAAIACLLASFLLFRHLSTTQELTTLRFAGLSLNTIITPLLILAALFSCTIFYLTSEYATLSHLKTRKMIYELTSKNPLLLLSHARIPKLKTAYVQMTPGQQDQNSKNIFISFFNPATSRINYILAEELSLQQKKLIAHNLSLISPIPKEKGLILENQKSIESTAMELTQMLMQNKGWKIANDHLNLRLLRVRTEEYHAEKAKAPKEQQKSYYKKIQKCRSEFVRRVALGVAPFTFTFMGMALGIHISRRQSKQKLVLVVFLAMTTFITFFIAKELSALFYLASALFLAPHLLILLFSWRALYRTKRGLE